MTPREWTAFAIAEDPDHEAFYRHHEWFCLSVAQEREWSAARGKLERQALARCVSGIEAFTEANDRLTAAMAKTSDDFASLGRAVRAWRAQEEATARAWRMFCGSTA